MTQTTLCPKEGWNVLHLFYRIDYAAWRLVSDKDQLNAKTAMSSLVQEVRAANNAQLLAFSVVSPKSGSRLHVTYARSAFCKRGREKALGFARG